LGAAIIVAFNVSKEGMMTRFWLSLGLAASLLAAGPALGQEPTQGYSADELAAILERDADPTFNADELAAILTPIRTRGLTPGTGIEPGSPGSGVVPDLKVRFGFDSAELAPAAKTQLDELGRALQTENLQAYRFRIAGYTDASGSEQYNERLSQQRASAVASYLTSQHGVTTDRLQALGLGERELADPQNPNDGVNRRVEVRTLD
jgi:outer membrane protein OmpA-like peptidoglycan-associated protein